MNNYKMYIFVKKCYPYSNVFNIYSHCVLHALYTETRQLYTRVCRYIYKVNLKKNPGIYKLFVRL